MTNPIPRRTFVGSAAATVALATLPSRAAQSPPDSKIPLGLIGCGWWGLVNAKAALKTGGAEVIAVCDVDSEHLAAAVDEIAKLQGSRPKAYKSYEELLTAEGLKAVVIATPPQWHALPFIAACARGLDIYCEKPLAYDIREGQAMVEVAAKSKNIVQIGFQRRQAAGFAEARKHIQAGNSGRIISAEAQIHYTADTPDATPTEPPASLDWDLWCGPGPLIPYSKAVGHKSWRMEKTSGHGHLADWGIHLIDAARWILGLGAPVAITSAGGLYHLKGRITTPDVLTAHFEFAECPLTWRHRIWGAQDFDAATSNGIFLYGEKETVFCSDNRWVVLPKGRDAKPEVHDSQTDSSGLHMAEFLEAIRTRKQPSVSTAEAHLSTTAVKLAMISYETNSKLVWDAATGEIPGNPEATKLLKREYRAPWKHPQVS